MAERLSASAGWELADAIRNLQRPQRESTSGTAVFNRRDPDGTCWVTLPGSDAETPVNGEAVASASPGDEVCYEIRDGMLSITGNTTDPAVGQTIVSGMVERARETVEQAVSEVGGVAGAAQRVANAINQHFWADTNGIHVTESTREDWADSQTGPNVLINSIGQLFRDGLTNLLTMTTESGARALTIWDGAGNAAGNVLATFGSVVRIGRESGTNVFIDSDSIDFYGRLDNENPLVALIAATGGGRLSFYKNLFYISALSSSGVSLVSKSDLKFNATTDIAMNSQSFDLTAVQAIIDATSTELSADSLDITCPDVLFDANGVTVALDSTGGMTVQGNALTVQNSRGESVINGNNVIVGSASYSNPVSLLSSNASANRGLYDNRDSQWIVYADSNGVVHLGGMVFRRGVVGQTNNVPAGSYKDVSVSFGHTYGSAPTVLVGLNSSSISGDIGQCSVAVASVSTTGFTARLFNASSAVRSPGFYWLAVG